MGSKHKHKIVPMVASGIQHLVRRTYAEGGARQWVRETYVNAVEAGATRVEYGVEWQAVEKRGVYRRTIVDDGQGMTAEQLRAYFNTFGSGGKAIGGAHENFGVGSKTSLLPWNPAGVVVVSWVKGEAAMIWLERGEDGEYGLRVFEAGTTDDRTLEEVVTPFHDRAYGCHWAKVKPEWLGEHGTVIVLLGADDKADTIEGDPERDERDLKGIASYPNRRVWEIPAGVQVTVEEMRSNDRATWPRSEAEAHGPIPITGPDRRSNRRTINGARHYVEYPSQTFKRGELAHHGTLTLEDKTKAHWFLWKGDRPQVAGYAAEAGFVAALYRNELYDVVSHLAVYRSFGITDAAVRARVTIVLEPPPYDEATKVGVYPRTDRNALLLRAGDAGGALPLHNWAAEFADRMPEPIVVALRESRGGGGTVEDETWRDRIAERFGTRWRIERRRGGEGEETVDPTAAGDVIHAAASRKGRKNPERERDVEPGDTAAGKPAGALGTQDGATPAAKTHVGGGIPYYRVAKGDEVEPGMLAAWSPHDTDHPEGVVLLNVDHPVIREVVKHWTDQYADHLAEQIEKDVIDVYGQNAVAKIAHSEKFRGILPSGVVDEALRSDAALTMALLGLFAEESLIAARLGARYGRQRRAAG